MITANNHLNTVLTVESENMSNKKHSFIWWININRLLFNTKINSLSCNVGIANSHMNTRIGIGIIYDVVNSYMTNRSLKWIGFLFNEVIYHIGFFFHDNVFKIPKLLLFLHFEWNMVQFHFFLCWYLGHQILEWCRGKRKYCNLVKPLSHNKVGEKNKIK